MRLSEFMHLAGETFQVERGEETFTVEGLRNKEEKRVDFEPGTDVRQGDWLRSPNSGNRFYVRETDVRMYQRSPFSVQAFYQTEAEYEADQAATMRQEAPVFNIFGDTFGSNIGTQHHAQVFQPTFTFGELEQEIDRRGGEDAEALKEMVQEIRDTLEGQDSLSRGKLARFSELLNRHGWITGPIAQLLLLYTITGQFS